MGLTDCHAESHSEHPSDCILFDHGSRDTRLAAEDLQRPVYAYGYITSQLRNLDAGNLELYTKNAALPILKALAVGWQHY